MAAENPIPFPLKAHLQRRTAADRSQPLRRWVQLGFAALNLALGITFFLWVRTWERGAEPLFARPAGVDGWLPIEGLMNTRYWIATGQLPTIHPAAMVLFLAFVAISLLLKKAFCSWLCPVGTLSEYLWKLGRDIFGRSAVFPRWFDIPLRGLKYLLLGFFVWIVGAMSAETLAVFLATPYGMLADAKMLNFFRHASQTAVIVLLMLAALSVLVENFWCRYLCPYGALMGLVSLLSPVKIRRDREACIDCGGCARACPSALKVDQLVQVRSAECTACMACVAACPAENALQFALPARRAETAAERWRSRALSPAAVAVTMAVLFLGAVALARLTGHWQTDLPADLYRELIPQIGRLSHPGY